MIVKLYRILSSELQYHEAWFEGGNVTEHWGTVGHTGQTKIHRGVLEAQGSTTIEYVLAGARKDGFTELTPDDHAQLVVEYSLLGSYNRCVDKRLRLEHLLNERLGWTGLGHCDGGSVGGGTMAVRCLVVDFLLAQTTVKQALVGTEFADYSRVYRADWWNDGRVYRSGRLEDP